jgi:hypothetical protein
MTLTEIKSALVVAHRNEDWEEAKRLSQLKEKQKKKRYCVDCGVRLSTNRPLRCKGHATLYRFHGYSLALVLLFAAFFGIGATPTNTVPIVLVWDNPGPQFAFPSTITYRVYWTTNIATPTNQWPLLATVTNPVSINSGTQLAWTNAMVPGVYFFTMTSSNLWGTTPFCAAAMSPPPAPLLNNLGLLPGQ